MGDFGPYHQYERDEAAGGCCFFALIVLSICAVVALCLLVSCIGDARAQQVPQVQPIELRD